MAGPRIYRRGGAGRELCAKTPAGDGAGRQIFAPPRPVANTKAKVERLTLGSSKPERKSPSPMIFEVEDSSSDAMDLYD